MLRVHLRLTLFFAILATTVVLQGSRPVFWQTASVSDFVRGEVENLSIDNTGRLILGPRTELLSETTAPFLWSMVAAPDGSLYVGSGNEGKVFKVDPAGRTTTFFDATELEVHAIVLAPGGDLYVGTSPDGQIYKVDSAGRGTPFFDPEAKYIWSLALDASGNVYAATGERGVIYKIAPDGTGTTFYQTRATHVISLAFDREGQLLAGTESPGRLFRIDRGGKAFLLLDSTFQEVHAIRLDPQGVIYATALSAPRPGAGDARPAQPTLNEPPATTGREPTPTETTEVVSIVIADAGAGSAPQPETPRADRRGPRGAIYRIRPDGLWDVLWESGDDSPYDLTFDGTGGLLVGTGRGGKLFRLTGDPTTATLLMQASAQQITGFARDAKGTTYYATSNPGKIFRLSTQRATGGSYISPVRDAQTVSDWGTLSWRANVPAAGRIEIFTRSGNTATPDDTWSAWAGPYQRPEGDDIRSPNARYLQWRAVLAGKDASPVLTSVTAAYLQRNLRPQVTSVTVHPPGTVFQKPFPTGELDLAGYDDQAPDRKILTASSNTGGASAGTTALGRRVYQRGLQTFVWRAEDENDDELRYAVQYRREGDTAWKVLKEDVADPIFVWDTTSVPNGTYFVKIVASDETTNPVGNALQGERESIPFDIDNTPPVITVTGSRQDARGVTVLQFEVRDDLSAIQKVEYSLDAERWRISYPMDGIFDSRLERFELPLEGDALVKGLIIRAVDAKNNTATGRGDVPARPR